MPPLNMTTSYPQHTVRVPTFRCPVLVETLLDPILRFAKVSPTLCDRGGVQGAQYIVVLAVEIALCITVMRVSWKCFSYFGWWRAVCREINDTREELGLMAEEEW
jgi:hypothetical protein